jgi:hypothetical protein
MHCIGPLERFQRGDDACDTPSVFTDLHHERDRAARLIQKGEELTCNYHTDFADDPVFGWQPGGPV